MHQDAATPAPGTCADGVIYLDNGATTALTPKAFAAMRAWLEGPEHAGNPGSRHLRGRLAHEAVKAARATVARLLGARPDEVVFTASGSEANALAIFGLARERRATRGTDQIVCAAIEHESALRAVEQLVECEGFTAEFVPPEPHGALDAGRLGAAITERTAVVVLMHVNNETGVIQPVAEVARLCQARGVPLACDGVAAVTRLPVDFAALGVTAYSLAAHKFHGPKGIGACLVSRLARLRALIPGGEQERGRRAGTENVPGIVGLAAALSVGEAARPAVAAGIRERRDRLERGLLAAIPETRVNGAEVPRIPHVCNVAFAGLHGESLITDLDAQGLAASAGAACAAHDPEPSHVLRAMGVPLEVARGALRLSLSRDTTDAEIDRALALIPPVVAALR